MGECPSAALRAVSDKVVAKALAGFQTLDGLCSLAAAGVSSPWPLRAGSANTDQPPLFAEGMSLSMQILEPVNGLVLQAYNVPMRRLACPPGHSFDTATARCRTCLATQYVLRPDQARFNALLRL